MTLLRYFRAILFATYLMSSGAGVVLAEPRQDPPKAQESKPAETKPEESSPDKSNISPVAAPVDPKSYVIGAQDVVLVSVWREKEISGYYVVRPDGKISMPLAGDIVAEGTTPDQLKERVTKALTEYMTKPEVMIEIRQVNSKRYYMTGEINRPGAYPLITPVTVLEAISNAGGIREFANGRKIVIMRNGERLKFNYKEVIKGKNMEQNIKLEPGDHVIVP